jgi:hypothetical protein
MERDSSMKVKIGPAPENPLSTSIIMIVIKDALKVAFPESENQVMASGPQIIQAVIDHQEEYASEVVWSLANVGINILLKDSGPLVEKAATEENVQ